MHWKVTASRMQTVTRGSRVAFCEGLRMKLGTVDRVDHDHYRIACDDGFFRRVLKERVEALTTEAKRT